MGATMGKSIAKGFQEFRAFADSEQSIRRELVAATQNKYTTEKEKGVLNKVIDSYDKQVQSQPLGPEDFVLSPHEVADFNELEPAEVGRYLRYRYAYNKFPDLHITEEYPPCVQIEIASVCNYRCTMCFQVDSQLTDKNHGHMGLMKLDMYKNIIDQIEGHVEGVTLASRGEPTLNKNFVQILEYSADKFLGFKINTNASLLTEDKCHAILSNISLGTIVFSLETIDAATYAQIRVNGSFSNVLDNVKRFKRIRQKYYPSSKLITRISGVSMPETSSMEKMESYWSRYVDQVSFVHCSPWTSIYEGLPANDITEPCGDLWRRMFIWWDGKVNPCDYDYRSFLSVGNLEDGAVSSLWTSPLYQDLRQSHMSGNRCQHVPCRQCPSV